MVTVPISPFNRFVESEGIPLFRGKGIKDVRELPRTDWKRMGGKGSYIQFDGTEGIHSMYVVEIPGGQALKPERHLYEEEFYVVEGRGSTEVWYEGTKKQTFEWAQGSLFTVPTNSFHQLVNAGSSPALIIVGSTAPEIINVIPEHSFVFENDHQFVDLNDDYYKVREELEVTTYTGRAARRTNLIPDLLHTELPLDNQRLPGFRRIEPHLGSDRINTFMWQYPSGRYSRAHGHSASAIIICLKGRAYTLNWPTSSGPTPWQDGKAETVQRFDYVAGGMVAAAPGGGTWFHQHFACSKEEPRFLIFGGGYSYKQPSAVNTMEAMRPGEEHVSTNWDLEEGGGSIGYYQEDPMIRKIYEEELNKEGAALTMPQSVYQRPNR
jgi:quercetin dioxygenase-like cupin family protein